MKPIGTHNYFVYILTNKNKTVLYVGVTNDIERRLAEHQGNDFANRCSFNWKYNCFYLVYFERYEYIESAIDCEKQLKGWKREKKEELIGSFNPGWKFLNEEIF